MRVTDKPRLFYTICQRGGTKHYFLKCSRYVHYECWITTSFGPNLQYQLALRVIGELGPKVNPWAVAEDFYLQNLADLPEEVGPWPFRQLFNVPRRGYVRPEVKIMQ